MQQTRMGNISSDALSRLANFHSTVETHLALGNRLMNKALSTPREDQRHQEFVNAAYAHFDNADDANDNVKKLSVTGLTTPVSRPGMTDPGQN